MVSTQRSTPETCAYCDAAVGDEREYRRHLHDAHDPSELGAIDRRRYERYRPEPSAVVDAGSELAATLGALRYPVDATAMARYALYGVVSSLFVSAALGVGL